MHIAVFAQERNVSSHYRAIEPMQALATQGHRVERHGDATTVPPAALACDVAIISRYRGRPYERLARRLRDAGAAVVWDHDDAVALAPQFNHRALEGQRRRSEISAMVRLSDVVTTTNEMLAEHFRELGADRVVVIENYLGAEFADLRPESHAGCILGWTGYADHQSDWEALRLRETFERALDAHADLRVESVGQIRLGLRSDRYTARETVPLPDLGLAVSRFDVGIAPIADTPFNRGRSTVKLKEYAAAGAAWLASPIGPYSHLGEKQGGRLVGDDGWFEAIDALLSRPRLRRKLAKRARKWGAQQLLALNTGPWEDALAEAVERAHSRSGRATV